MSKAYGYVRVSTSAEDMKQIEQIKKWVSEMARKSFLE